MGIYLKRYCQEKPPIGSTIDFGHSLVKDLVGCWLMNEGGGRKIFDLLNYSSLTIFGSPAFRGSYLNFPGSTSDYAEVSSNSLIDISGAFTLVARIFMISTALNQRIIGKWNFSPTGVQYGLLAFNATQSFALYTSSTELIETSANVFLYNNWYTVSAVHFGNGTGKIYNGINDVTSDGTAANIVNSTQALRFSGANGSVLYFKGLMAYVYLYKRALNSVEIRGIYEAPYQFIQTPRRIFYSLSTGAISVPNPRRSMTGVNRIKGIKAVTF